MEHLGNAQSPVDAEELLTEYLATEEHPFHFTDSGLDDVYLVGIRYFTSASGKLIAEIPAMNQLLRLISQDLVLGNNALRGNKIRFLRKRLGMKSSDYARLLRIDGSTLSRIENDKQPPSDQLEALVRMSYVLLCDDPAMIKHAEKLKETITAEVRRSQLRIVMKVSADNEWSDVEMKEAA